MGIFGDTAYDLMGFTDPRKKLISSLTPAPAGAPAGAPAPVPPNQFQPTMAQGGVGPDQQNPPAPPAPPPQPQAYTSAPDFSKMYLDMLNRQEGSDAIDRGMGMLFAGFAQPQDRAGMVNAMSTSSSKDPASMITEMQTAQLNQQKVQARVQLLQMAPTLAKQLNMPVEQVISSINSGAMDNIIQEAQKNRLTLADPLHQAQTASTQAEVPLKTAEAGKDVAETGAVASTIAKTKAETDEAIARTGAIPSTVAKTQAETGKTVAETGVIPSQIAKNQADTAVALATVPKTQADVANIQAQTVKTQQDTAQPTDQVKNYTYYANGELAGKRQPVSFNDWLASGGTAPTEQMKDYRLAMTQVPEGQSKPSFDEWTAKNAGMKEAATQSGLLQTQQKMNAQNQLPDATDKIVTQLKLADDIANDPSLKNLTSYGGTTVGKFFSGLPGTAGANLQAKIDQLSGSAGVSAVESLKGVGRILGTEFTAGTEAQSRLHDQTVNIGDYKGAITDYRNKIAGQLRNVYDKAGMPVPAELNTLLQGPTVKRRVYDAQGNLQ